jgi:N-succinyldiaminopimelate aminotransferase
VTANEKIIKKLLLYRTYHGATLSVPAQKASTWAWSNDLLVKDNRKNYDEKYAVALEQIDPKFNVTRPSGGFYLWIELPIDDLTFTKKIYEDHNVIVLPGSYLGVENNGINPGSNFIRVAIVHDDETVKKAALAINDVLNHFTKN